MRRPASFVALLFILYHFFLPVFLWSARFVLTQEVEEPVRVAPPPVNQGCGPVASMAAAASNVGAAKRLARLATSFTASKVSEGAGFIVARPIGHSSVPELDPFLLLDHFGPINYKPGEAKGAPWHPHRGFETVSYILQGEMQHRDSMGNSGLLRAGDVQWMTAGSGVTHDEQPSDAHQATGGTMEGFQLWVNLPRANKMMDPRYFDISKDDIPTYEGEGFRAVVIAGNAFGTQARVDTVHPVHYIDFQVQPNVEVIHTIAAGMNAAIYIYRGTGKATTDTAQGGSETETSLSVGRFLVVEPDEDSDTQFVVRAGDEGVRFIFLAGKPINEPIARRGPFVMSTNEELVIAFDEYRRGTFIKAKGEMKSVTRRE